jgi:hypothetical protein
VWTGGVAAGQGLLGHGHDLRGGDDRGDQPGQRDSAQPGPLGPAGQPRRQRQRQQDRHQDRRFLVGQQGGGDHQAQDDRLPGPGAAAQPDRGLQRHRDGQCARGQVQVIPALVDHHRGQAEERPRRDRPDSRQPQPRRPVRGVAQQRRHGHRQQVVGERGPERQRDRGHQRAGQRHQRMKAQRHPHGCGQVAGAPRVGQVGDLVGHPPEPPDIAARVLGVGQDPAQVGGARPAHRHPHRQVTGQQPGLAGHPAANRARRPQISGRRAIAPDLAARWRRRVVIFGFRSARGRLIASCAQHPQAKHGVRFLEDERSPITLAGLRAAGRTAGQRSCRIR